MARIKKHFIRAIREIRGSKSSLKKKKRGDRFRHRRKKRLTLFADADLDLRQRPVIAHPAKPFGKDFGLADLDRSLTIIHNFRFFKDTEQILRRRLRRMKMPPDRLGRLARDDCRERFDCRLLDFAEGAEVS